MRTIWTILSIIAVANLLALLAFAGWLGNSGRLNEDRLERVRSMFSETIAEEAARLEQEAAEAAAAEAERPELLPDGPIATSAQLAELRAQAVEMDLQRETRVRREIDDLRRALQLERDVLDEERAAFEADRQEFEQMRAEINAVEGDEQFRKSLSVLSGMKAADAMQTLAEIHRQGETDRVVSYLNAMEERIRTKIMSEFVKDGETQLAADLLERLRVRGLVAAAAEGSPG